ncbi:DNA mismatch repair protein MutS [Dyadobacter sp. LJ53]|uniref:MutS-related protein n=1 Tax=Dyadobacter chenwenxiniae TaxID=2906456 RepID=UPI001F31AA47|nr:DNA mismatch repair protein MutS [Dyadobacter chenwenxiniae]MCF0052877.1 DNA mismatch repair protein MutS [Dyadobacter chenwenxiniae]
MHPIDSQTLQELHIIPKNPRDASILNFFDRSATEGGRDHLRQLLTSPKRSHSDVIAFQDLLKAIMNEPDAFKIHISRTYVAAAEAYYGSNIAYSMSQDVVRHWFDTLIFSLRNPAEFYMVQSGFFATFKVLKAIEKMTAALPASLPDLLKDDVGFLNAFLNKKGLRNMLRREEKKLSIRVIFYWDYFLRIVFKKELRSVLDIFYKFDAYQAISQTAIVNRLSFPEFDERNTGRASFNARDIWHPLIKAAVPNSISLDNETPVCMLTGANTSGKTTFLKTCGIAVYLAHLGWPVPATGLRLTFCDRLFTSIHLSDDISLGYSHFYSEVMRIKTIAEALYAGENCFIVIDELFRGTNQEDSLQCSIEVIGGFARHKNSLFFVSTHLEPLLQRFEHEGSICFRCFRTHIKGDNFINSYQIENGISSERLGQIILKKAGIELLLNGKKE